MATSTYTLIEEQVLGSSASSVTFSSIPGTYKDLVLEVTGSGTSGTWGVLPKFNNDSGTNYSVTQLTGNGTTASSARETNATYIAWFGVFSTTLSTAITHIQSYANTNVYKTTLTRVSNSGWGTSAAVGLWRSTAAITSIELYNVAGSQFATGSTFRLWGIA